MELAAAFFADSVIVQDGKFFVWGGGIDRTYAAGFPAYATFFLVARVNFEASECGRPHKLEVNVIDEDGKPVGPGAMPPSTVIPQRDLADPTLAVAHIMVLGFQGFPFERPCKVIFSILADDREIGSLLYQAVKMAQAPATGWQSRS